MWRVSWAMKSKAEKCFSLPLKYPEVQDFQVTVSWSSSQWKDRGLDVGARCCRRSRRPATFGRVPYRLQLCAEGLTAGVG